MTRMFLDDNPGLVDVWSSQNPQNRIGRPDELRGVATWLASDASSYCTGSEYVPILDHTATSNLTCATASSSTADIVPGEVISCEDKDSWFPYL